MPDCWASRSYNFGKLRLPAKNVQLDPPSRRKFLDFVRRGNLFSNVASLLRGGWWQLAIARLSLLESPLPRRFQGLSLRQAPFPSSRPASAIILRRHNNSPDRLAL